MTRRRAILMSAVGAVVLLAGAYGIRCSRSAGTLNTLLEVAESQGFRTKVLSDQPNLEAQEILIAMDKLPDLDTFSGTEELAGIVQSLKQAEAHWPYVQKLLKCEKVSGDQPIEFIAPFLNAIGILELRARRAILSGDFQGLVESSKATRKLAALLPREDLGAVLFLDRIIEGDCSTLQEAAETMALDPMQYRQLERLAAEWGEPDFAEAAKNRLAEHLEWLEEPTPLLPNADLLDRIEHVWSRSSIAINDRKAALIRSEMKALAAWNNPQELRRLSIHELPEEPVTKRSEIKLVSMIRALRLTLCAYRLRAEGKPWPTMAELEAGGLTTKDPLKGEKYSWRECFGRMRVVGWNGLTEQTAREYVIMSGRDPRSEKARSVK